MVERARKRQRARARNQAMAGFDAEHAAKRGRTDHRAVGLRSDRQRHHAGSHRRGRARGRAARRAVHVARISRLARMEIGELGCHRLADDHRARLAQPGNRGGIRFRPAAGENRRAALGRKVGRIKDILDSDRDAVQRANAPATGLVPVERARLRQRVFGIEMGESLNVAFDRLDPAEASGGIFLGRHRAARDVGGSLHRRQRGHVGSRHFRLSRRRDSSAATASCPARDT